MIDFFIDAAEAAERLGDRDPGGGQYQARYSPPTHSPECGCRDREWWRREAERTGLGDWQVIGELATEIIRTWLMEPEFMRACRLDGGGP